MAGIHGEERGLVQEPVARKKATVALAAFWVLTGWHLFLAGAQRIHPFVDLPNHLAEAAVVRFYGDPGNDFARYYAVDLFPKPNVLHTVFCASSIFPSVEFANKIYLCSYTLLLPLSVLLLIRKLGGNAWYALLSFPLLYNFSVLWGFVGYVITIPFVVLFLCLLVDYPGRHGAARRVLVAAWLVALVAMHALGALFGMLLFGATCAHRFRRSPLRAVAEMWPILPASAYLTSWWFLDVSHAGESTLRFLWGYYPGSYLLRFPERLGLAIYDNCYLFFYFPTPGRAVPLVPALLTLASIALAASLFLVIMAIAFRPVLPRWRSFARESWSGRTAPALTFFLCSLACCLLLPDRIPGNMFLFERFGVYLGLSAIVLGSLGAPAATSRVKKGVILAACLVHVALWSHYFWDFHRENRDFTREVFPISAKGKTLAFIPYEYRFRGRPTYVQFPSFHLVWNQGIAVTNVTRFRYRIVGTRPGSDPLPDYDLFFRRNEAYDGTYSSVDYILIRGELPDRDARRFENLTLVRSRGVWHLYEQRPEPSLDPRSETAGPRAASPRATVVPGQGQAATLLPISSSREPCWEASPLS